MALTIEWTRRAVRRVESISVWYNIHLGPVATSKFLNDLFETIDLLASNPTIGIIEERRCTQNKTYKSFLIHPKYRIVYRFTESKLVIVAIRANEMKK